MATPYLGEIRLFAGNFPPAGWAFCNGQQLNVQDYPALYGVIGSTYGGDGTTVFNLPDLQGRVPVHAGNGLAIGKYGGVEGVALQPSQLPSHTHTVNCASTGNIDDPTGNFWGSSGAKPYSAPPGTLTMNPAAVSTAGGGVAHENRIPYLAMSYIIALNGAQPKDPTNPYQSEMRIFPYNTIPSGWMVCEGQLMSINTNPSLYTLIGNTYGGDGRSTFALPDLRGRAPMNNSPTMPLGQTGGEATHTLTVAEMPQHSHVAVAAKDIPNANTPAGNYWASNTGYNPYNAKADTQMAGTALMSTGGDVAHENMAPYVTAVICMAIQGVYPLGAGMSDQYIGEVRMFGGQGVPTGWAKCDGSLLNISANTALFSLLGTFYGGNGTTNFGLPSLSGRAAIGTGSGAGLSTYTPGDEGGVASVTLTLQEMAAHSHVAIANQIGTLGPPIGAVWANPNTARPAPNFYVNTPQTTVSMSPDAIEPLGSSQPHNNLMPYTVVAFYIALQGEFPNRG
jgi:microcystin-dependent protein